MKSRNVLALMVILVTIALCACTGGRHSDFASLEPAKGWAYTDTLIFTTMDTTRQDLDKYEKRPHPMTAYVAIRHNDSYPYANLWLEATYTDSKGQPRIDTLNMRLADEFGRWQGKGFGTSYQIEVSLGSRVRADSMSTVRIRHIMRVDTLRGIDRVGINLYKNDSY